MIVLNGLDAEGLAQKGALLDLSETVKPMEEAGALLQNIVDGEKSADGSLQVIPVRFSMPLILSKEKKAATMTDLASLSKAGGSTPESLLGTFSGEDFVELFAPYFMDDIVSEKALDEEKLRSILEELKAVAANCDLVEKYREKGEGASNEWDLPSSTQAALCRISGFNDAMFDLAIVNLVKGDYASFENAYVPTVEVGVNADTKQSDLVKEFVTFLLDREVQDGDFYDGFPVNQESLHMQVNMDRSAYAAYTTIEGEDGSEVGLDIKSIQKEDADKLEAICLSLSKRIRQDDKVMEELKKAVPAYLLDQQSLEDTVQKLSDALRIYLAE